MTDTKINLAVAKAIGWTDIEQTGLPIVGGDWVGYPPYLPIVGIKGSIPNFCGDLNAVHQAEKHLRDSERDLMKEYKQQLDIECLNDFGGSVHAAAYKRAICLLRVLEGKPV